MTFRSTSARLFSQVTVVSVLLAATVLLPAMAGDEVPLPMIYSAITKTVEPHSQSLTQPLRPYIAPLLTKPAPAPIALVAVAAPASAKGNAAAKFVVANKATIKTATTTPKPPAKATSKPVPKQTVAKASAPNKGVGVSPAMKAQAFLAVPMGLASGQTLPETYTTASTVLSDLQKSPSLSWHVEALRRAAHSLPPSQYAALVSGMQQRLGQQPSSAVRQFDWGYTKLVFENNKAGLFYLRKAHDELQSPVSALTYGLAQAAVDTLVEKAPPTDMTIRKLDVMHKLDDALMLHAKHPVAGFWPTYRAAMNQLASVPMYADWVATDRSETLVPTGDSVELAYNFMAMTIPSQVGKAEVANATTASNPLTTMATATESSLCQRQPFNPATQQAQGWNPKDAIKTVGVTVQGNTATAYVFQGAHPQSSPTMVITQGESILARVTSKRVPYVLEDTNHDNTPEIVVRQFLTEDTTPELGGRPAGPVTLSETPLQVYRYNGCQYELDKTVSSLFE